MSKLTVWKFEAQVRDDVVIEMPRPGVVIDVKAGPAPDQITVWAIVDPPEPMMERKLKVRGTGHPMRDVGPHVATIQADPFVWHIFESPEVI